MRSFTKKYLVFIAAFMIYAGTAAYAADYVVPSGKTVGIKIYADGLIVTDVCDFAAAGGGGVCPARDAGITAGDVIKSANGSEIVSCEQFSAMLDGGSLNITVNRGGQTLNICVIPSLGEDGKYHIGAWVRDSTAGIGTLTFYNPETLEYRTLGHAVTDIDTGNIIAVEDGNIQECTITEVTKGYIGFAGYVSAEFGADILGTVDGNSECGIFGRLNTALSNQKVVLAAGAEEAHEGDAAVLTDICGNGVEEYGAEIKIISENDTRNMVIKITDSRLIAASGGIVQGMSGAPIMQDGKLIGAVTHVFVNDPTRGYGIFIENMIDNPQNQ